ncbi:type IV pilus modification protein PilV [Chromobacterium sp. IIBBL 290-4]|uniref:type IV pilus modification protein PilV n=1 Tax=Chromobacterium sp. IIBBL 290-4 TaxID=2953890 RepID=UPI0020B6905A|nr:type IV pilus modification protein PilV [Chromobacterium sp. IIBBL 290-4]UTH74330.1 type IV pilus modification protein PilV [Chromobacterium sp. IIBBL 290-4]
MSMIPRSRRQSGFSMLEVLVALFVISLGLLGIAGMQAAAINNVSIARTRSLGAIAAESMAAAMHANTAYWGNLSATASNTWTVNASSVTGTPTLSQTLDCSVAGNSCTASGVAGYDVTQWGRSTLATLPGASGQIACTAGSGSSPTACTITVSWLEKKRSVNAATTASGTLTQNYQMVVEP